MKKIKDLLSNLKGKMIQGSDAGEITELVYDSRNIVPGCAFVCLKGASFDGHDYA